eukprot:TRINITY_DN2654_c0_g2_i1.p1 TRINITY_DN2654_c0_g2~~TRINITY_DN2654_c0_g2_i1.p1  ORF type:complete len:185 (-),score=24.87 TRINITY_DN2654_c0_g2_i1:112-666(-)
MCEVDLEEYLEFVEECLQSSYRQNVDFIVSSTTSLEAFPTSPRLLPFSSVPYFSSPFSPNSPATSVPSPGGNPSSPSSSSSSSPPSPVSSPFHPFGRASLCERKKARKSARKKRHGKQKQKFVEEIDNFTDYRSSANICECEGCTRRECQTCKYCLDQKRYGGKRKLRQRCVLRKCCFSIAKPQ